MGTKSSTCVLTHDDTYNDHTDMLDLTGVPLACQLLDDGGNS